MKKLYLTIISSALLLCLIPLRASMACSTSSPLFTHFVYMFTHASILHWICNAWSLLVFHNLFSIPRLLVAYVLAVGLSFIPLWGLQRGGVLGMSVFVCFFLGLAARWLFINNRPALLLSIVLLVLSCFLPGFAGAFHLIMFALGFVYMPVEILVKTIVDYVKG